jgi:CDP-4-dehydro-6-deoxyglucose reductase
MEAKLIESREIAPDVRHFVFETPGTFNFVPGQFVSIQQTIDEKKITRAYSIASEPMNSNRFELCLDLVKEGRLSPRLFAMQPGDAIEIKPPMGMFVLKTPPRESVLIATGTGITPFRSMLRAYAADPARRFTLLFGARHERDLLYREEFENMERLRFLPTLSRPGENWTGRRGYVQEHLNEAIGERRDIDVFLCGMKEMVDQVRNILKDMGFERKQILFEKYD